MSVPPPPRPDRPADEEPPAQPGRAWAPPATWRAVEAIPVFFVAIAGALLLSIPIPLAIQSCSAQFVLTTFVGELAFVLAVLGWVRGVNHGSLASLGLPREPLRDLGSGLVGGIVMFVAAAIVLQLVQWVATAILGHTPTQPEQVQSCVRGVGLVLLGPVVILVAPMGEELFFRGFLYKGLRRRRSVATSALISGFFFGLVHFGGVSFLLIIPSLMVVGVVLALVYERRQSVLASMVAHGLFNLVGYLSIYVSRK